VLTLLGNRPALMKRAVVCAVALACGLVAWLAFRFGYVSDLFQFWYGDRVYLRGQDPYVAVPARWPWIPPYPFPAFLLTIPLAPLSFAWSRVVWAAISGAVFTVASLREPRLRPALLSPSFVQAITLGQWSPLLTASAVIPWLSPVLIVKPTVGLALWLRRPRWVTIVGAVIFLAASVILLPSWPMHLWDARHAIHRAPVTRPFGFVLLLAWLRWRTPEGRLLGAMALVPHSTAIYEVLPLFLIARTRGEAGTLLGLSYLTLFSDPLIFPGAIPPNVLPTILDSRWPVMFVCLYLPALIMVLRSESKTSGDG
jgi:hypothetical protein